MSMNADRENSDHLRQTIAELERQLDAVRQIAIKLSTTVEPEELIRQALDVSLVLTGAEAGSILLYDADKETLVFKHVIGEKAEELTGRELSCDKGLAGEAFKNREIIVSDDVSKERAHLREIGEEVGYITQNMVTVPLMSPEADPSGVMQIINKREARFTQSDLKLIETIAAQIALAIETLHLQQEARLAAIMRFIGNIGHDVKNMITPASVGAQTLERIAGDCFQILDECQGRQESPEMRARNMAEALGKLRASYPEIVDMILESCDCVQQRMAQISAAMKGTVSAPRFEPANIAAIASRVGNMLQPQAKRKGVSLTIEAADELPEAMVDAKQIFNAIYNLILNAIDACASGDRVTLRLSCQAGGDFPAGNHLVIECEDTGPGIPEHIQAKLFTEKAVSTKPMGTGLGTRIVRDVVESHGGHIDLDSKSGSGTRICCHIPLRREAA